MIPALLAALMLSLPTIGILNVPVDPGQHITDPNRIGQLTIKGNTVLLGHRDWAGQPRAFSRLRYLEINDSIIYSGEHYRINWISTFAYDDLESWQQSLQADPDSLTLVTCHGAWSVSRSIYLERLVVRAGRVE